MMPLVIYLFCAGLVVLGALAFIAALRIPGPIRMIVACGMACVPIAAGAYLFHSSGLKVSDLSRLVRAAGQEMETMSRGIERNHQVQRELIQ